MPRSRNQAGGQAGVGDCAGQPDRQPTGEYREEGERDRETSERDREKKTAINETPGGVGATLRCMRNAGREGSTAKGGTGANTAAGRQGETGKLNARGEVWRGSRPDRAEAAFDSTGQGPEEGGGEVYC